MKKMVIGLAVCGLGVASGMDGILSTLGESRLGISGGGIGSICIREGVMPTVVERREAIHYHNSFSLEGDTVTLLFVKGSEVGERFREESFIERSYPYEKEFIGLEPADGNHSYAIYKLFTNTEEVGEVMISDHFIDENNALEHQHRIVGSLINDDDHLISRGKVETYLIIDGVEHSVSVEENGSIPYTFLRTEKDTKYADAPDNRDNIRIYTRWNGDEVRRSWDDSALIEKTAPQPPVQAPAPQYHQVQHRHRGGFFRKAFGW